MTQSPFAQFSDDALLAEARRNTPSPWFDAFFIGGLVGIMVFGAAAGAGFFFLLLPLGLIYLMLKKPKRHAELQRELQARGLHTQRD